MSSLKLFNFGDHNIRVFINDGKPAWVASDLMGVLEFSERTLRRRISELDEDEYTYVNADLFLSPESSDKFGTSSSSENNQNLIVVFESGLYHLIESSRSEAAKPFKRLVRKVILPAIQRDGGYISDTASLKQIEALQEQLEIQKAKAIKAERVGFLKAANKLYDPTILTDEQGAVLRLCHVVANAIAYHLLGQAAPTRTIPTQAIARSLFHAQKPLASTFWQRVITLGSTLRLHLKSCAIYDRDVVSVFVQERVCRQEIGWRRAIH